MQIKSLETDPEITQMIRELVDKHIKSSNFITAFSIIKILEERCSMFGEDMRNIKGIK